ncbi:lysis system i-spanin subunit Rz [Providencia rustigianii]|uniref:lysis system i-spanin subunit Rz n=1 Tax=Providencia rustigianii TaxID=158850 RepID=UPI0038B40916
MKHTKELANAKVEINKLHNDVHNAAPRVYVKAENPKSEANSTENGGNESTLRLSEIVEQNYWCLRSTMTEHEMQTLYLQDNIRMVCLRSPSSNQ